MAYAMHGLPASYASATALARPVLASAAAWLLFGEAMGPWQMAGAVLVLGGPNRPSGAHRDDAAGCTPWQVSLIDPANGTLNSALRRFRGAGRAVIPNGARRTTMSLTDWAPRPHRINLDGDSIRLEPRPGRTGSATRSPTSP